MNDSDDAIGQNENSVSQEECDDSDEEVADVVRTNGTAEQSSAEVSQDGSQQEFEKDEEDPIPDSESDSSSDSEDAGKENEDVESLSDSSDDSSEEDEAEVENKTNDNAGDNEEDDAVSLQDSEDDSSQDVDAAEEKKVTNVIYVGDNNSWLGKSVDNSPMVLSDSDEYDDEEDPVGVNQTNDAALKFLNINKELTIEGLNDNRKRPTIIETKSLAKPANVDTQNFASITIQKQTNSSDSNSKGKSSQHSALEAIYSNIAARGITLTPVTKQKTAPTPSSQNQATPVAPANQSQQVILSSLTDDMYVVEAPSFIVPYVYEKPSLTAFREYVDALKEELAAKSDLETPGTDDFDGNLDLSSLKDLELAAERDAVTKKRRSKKNADDDYSWDGRSSDSEDMSDDDKPKAVAVKASEIANAGSKPSTDNKPLDNYFVKPLGTFFMNIGMNLVQEHVQRDLLKQQKRKLYKENRTGEGDPKLTEAAIVSLTKNIESSATKNEQYKYEMKKCSFCSFQSESSLVVSHHLETPHMKSNLYKCNFCAFEIKSPHDILYHMEAEHNIRGRLERAPSYHPCVNCPFEDNGKSKLARHVISCAKKFKPEHNLAPPVEWEPPAKIPKVTGRAARAYQPITAKPPTMLMKANALPQVIPNAGSRKTVLPPIGQRPIQGAPLFKGGVMYRNNQQILPNNDYRLLQGGQTTIRLESSKASAKPVQHHPSISITPLPRASAQLPSHTPQVSASSSSSKATFVICEICDGYIKDLEQLRNHMMWIHKVKIHPKMIYNRPPLNCQKCQFRFFTDQGLERHLLGSHGLVTSSMQEAANKSKDAGRCPACGKVFQWKLLNHVARDHNMTLKPAYLSYKCTVCTATFGMYKLFENHVYSAHSGVARRVT